MSDRMRCFLCSLLLLACTVLARAQEEGETEIDYCFRSNISQYNVIFEEAFQFKLGNTVLFVNCMSFGGNRELKTAVVSGRNESGGTQVFEFVCKGNGLLAFDSSRNFSEITANNTCVECTDIGENACSMHCDPMCERCYGTADQCTQCVAAMVEKEGSEEMIECHEDGECPPNKTPNPDNHNICECTYVLDYDVQTVEDELDRAHGVVAEEEEIEEVIKEHAMCAEECSEESFEIDPHDENKICYACGIRFCMECEEEEETHHKECTRCLSGSLLYHEEGECLAGLRGEVLEVAMEQEEEVEEEEEGIRKTRLALAISLPIVCVLVILFFIMMSFIAHKRYPHIGKTGEKRHRRQRAETVGEEPLSVHEQVFRARPTVRLR